MLAQFLLSLPCSVSLVMAMVYALRRNRTMSENIMLALTLCSAVCFFAESNFLSVAKDYDTLVRADIINQVVRPFVPPLILYYLVSLVRERCSSWWFTFGMSFAAVIGAVAVVVYLLIGVDDAADYMTAYDRVHDIPAAYTDRLYKIYEYVCIHAYHATMCLYSTLSIILILRLFRRTHFHLSEIKQFLLHDGEMEPAHIEGVLFIVLFSGIIIKLLLGHYFYVEHQSLAILSSVVRVVLIFIISYIGLCRKATISLADIGVASSGTPPVKANVNVQSVSVASNCSSDLRRIADEKMYLDSHLTIDACALRLGTNRTYLSQEINSAFGCGFREYIGQLRVEYAKQYMLRNPDAIQDVIAEECGFADASSFNKKFKAIEGKSPRMWLMMHS